MADLNLTAGECLYVRRKRAGLSQSMMGRSLGVTRSEYSKIERDKRDHPKVHVTRMKLEIHETLAILRRREGMTQKELAMEVGLSRFWVNQMEIGKIPCDAISKYWKETAG